MTTMTRLAAALLALAACSVDVREAGHQAGPDAGTDDPVAACHAVADPLCELVAACPNKYPPARARQLCADAIAAQCDRSRTVLSPRASGRCAAAVARGSCQADGEVALDGEGQACLQIVTSW